ncbi:hypothetical protein PUV47_07300 [Pseudovibrio exalbescens]|uniref:hypothetical protein n=1 Tax=Pseudovibrio exalbescens TaxID=197461 RepID=UPI002367385A|nr:hypothetical protein [Pseudovibrio exalbescens]MDD7909721.1 hypothetical protein [Pseudovibrio exalbescens]
MKPFLAALAAVPLLTTSFASADTLAGTKWRPLNYSAQSTTGNLAIDENHLIFSDREHLPISAVGDRTSSIYKFTEAASLRFTGGRTFCANGVNTGYLQINLRKIEDQETLELLVFRGPKPPDPAETSETQRDLCSTYLYVR